MVVFIVMFYMVLMLLVGWWCSKHYIKNMTDFLLAGRRLGPVLLGAALMATHFGGGAVMGGGEYGFKYGLSGAWYGISCGLGLIFLSLVTSGKFRALSLYTVPDYLEKRYGGKTIRVLGCLLSLVALVGILAAQVIAAKGVLSILGITGNTGAIIAAIVFILYTVAGGLWATTMTDFAQIVIAGIGVVVASIIVIVNTGGGAGLINIIAEKGVTSGYFNLGGMGLESIVWLLLPTVMYTLIGQDFYQRVFAAKDAPTAKKASLIGGLILIILSLFPAIMGMGARGLSDLTEPGKAVPWILTNLMHPVVGGIILAAIIAAIMSTADSLLTAATSHFVKDLWIETFHQANLEEKGLLKFTRVSTILIGLIALLISLSVPSIIAALIYSYTMYTAGIFIPVIGGVLWKAATKEGAIVSAIVGSIIALVGILTKIDILGVPVEIYSALLSLIVFVLVSVVTGSKQIDNTAKI